MLVSKETNLTTRSQNPQGRVTQSSPWVRIDATVLHLPQWTLTVSPVAFHLTPHMLSFHSMDPHSHLHEQTPCLPLSRSAHLSLPLQGGYPPTSPLLCKVLVPGHCSPDKGSLLRASCLHLGTRLPTLKSSFSSAHEAGAQRGSLGWSELQRDCETPTLYKNKTKQTSIRAFL